MNAVNPEQHPPIVAISVGGYDTLDLAVEYAAELRDSGAEVTWTCGLDPEEQQPATEPELYNEREYRFRWQLDERGTSLDIHYTRHTYEQELIPPLGKPRREIIERASGLLVVKSFGPLGPESRESILMAFSARKPIVIDGFRDFDIPHDPFYNAKNFRQQLGATVLAEPFESQRVLDIITSDMEAMK